MKVQLVAEKCPWPNGYTSSVVAVAPGGVVDVPEAEAERLLSTFPGVFVPVAKKAKEPAPPPVPPTE